MVEDREMPCPACHQECGWCSWYAKNARDAGCGNPIGPHGRLKHARKCEWGEKLKGTVCGVCGGAEKVRAHITYSRIDSSLAQQEEG